jgi:hypothetical protein
MSLPDRRNFCQGENPRGPSGTGISLSLYMQPIIISKYVCKQGFSSYNESLRCFEEGMKQIPAQYPQVKLLAHTAGASG